MSLYQLENSTLEVNNSIYSTFLSFWRFAGDKDNEMSADEISGTVINPGGHYIIYTCGRSWSPTGTTGTFVLIGLAFHFRILRVEWDCPAISPKKRLVIRPLNLDWSFDKIGFNGDHTFEDGKIVCSDSDHVSNRLLNISAYYFNKHLLFMFLY